MTTKMPTVEEIEAMARRCENVYEGDHPGDMKDASEMLRAIAAGVVPPRIYLMGYPNANCPGCVKATSPTYWNHVRKMHPDVFARRAEQSRRIGAKLVRVKGKRIFLDELDQEAKGRSMKSMNIDCGIFCEEKQ